MTPEWSIALTTTRLLVLGLGIATTAISFRAYRAQGTRYLRDATLGFGLITVGVLLEGILFQLTDLALSQVHVVESLAIALGFVVILNSFLR